MNYESTPLSLASRIEAILFWKGEPLSLQDISRLTQTNEEEVLRAAEDLRTQLQGRGIVLVQTQNELSLGTTAQMSEVIAALRKEELSKDLGKAGLETLSIILYKGPVSRKEIDYIRGVNSAFIVRNLLIRGLIERVEESKNGRSFRYQSSIALLSFLGIQKVEDLPEFNAVKNELTALEEAKADAQPQESSAKDTPEFPTQPLSETPPAPAEITEALTPPSTQ